MRGFRLPAAVAGRARLGLLAGFRPERPGGRGLIRRPGPQPRRRAAHRPDRPALGPGGCGAGLQIGGQPGGFGAVRGLRLPLAAAGGAVLPGLADGKGRQNAPGALCGSAVAARLLCGAEQLGPFAGSQPGAPGPAGSAAARRPGLSVRHPGRAAAGGAHGMPGHGRRGLPVFFEFDYAHARDHGGPAPPAGCPRWSSN